MGNHKEEWMAAMRELFIDELTEVKGGGNPLKEILDRLPADSTMACCEEGQCCDPVVISTTP